MAAIRKSIDLILQNSTNELLTIESYNLIRGEWGPAGPPVRGDVIPKQGSKRWMSLSKALTGVDGYLHLGSTKGYIRITWHVPLSGMQNLAVDVTVPDRLASLAPCYNTELADYPVVLVTLVPGLVESPPFRGE